MQDLVYFSTVVLPAAVPPIAKVGDSGDGGGGGGGGRGGAVDVTEGEAPCHDGDGDGDDDAPLLKLSVVAHSMGGLIAVDAALKEPLLFERVRMTLHAGVSGVCGVCWLVG